MSIKKVILVSLSMFAITVVCLFTSYVPRENRYEEKDNQSWVILGFTDINYLKVTKLWYKRLSDLGYENHLIVALDNASYQNIILQGNYRCEKTADYLQAVGFKNIVRLRLTTIAQYLE